jgi:mono/diheme cytochrome c family protein
VTHRALRAEAALVLTVAAAAAYGTSRRALPVRAEDEPRPPALLSETGLHAPGEPGVAAADNRPFAPQYPLWTDGASKRRWVYLPPGTTIDASSTHAWEYPVGTKLWKEFSFGGRRVETRMLWKAAAEHWVVAAYVWNDEQTEALLAPEAGVPGVAEVAPGKRHGVPGRADCLACHGSPARPLGFGALQLSTDRDPQALHAEPLAPGMLTLATLVAEGRLSPDRRDLLASPPRIRAASPRTRAALGYLAANCGSCHDGRGAITANLPPLGYADVAADGDRVAASLVARATRYQVPGVAEGESLAVDPGAPERSALVARMRSRRPSSQMPPLGTVLSDRQALDAIAYWIAADLAPARVAAR